MPAGLLREFKLRFPLFGHDAPSSGVLPAALYQRTNTFIGRTVNSISVALFQSRDYANLIPGFEKEKLTVRFL